MNKIQFALSLAKKSGFIVMGFDSVKEQAVKNKIKK